MAHLHLAFGTLTLAACSRLRRDGFIEIEVGLGHPGLPASTFTRRQMQEAEARASPRRSAALLKLLAAECEGDAVERGPIGLAAGAKFDCRIARSGARSACAGKRLPRGFGAGARQEQESAMAQRNSPVRLIDLWAGYGAGLRRNLFASAMRSVPHQSAMEHFAGLGRRHAEFRLRAMTEALRQSAERLAPLDDPLAVDFGLHRWLSPEREESYSDWLAWLLGELRDGPAIAWLLLGTTSPVNSLLASAPLRVDREVWVPEGHAGRAGRLDCVIEWPEAMIVIEVKKTEAENWDIAKHEGYVNWLSSQEKSFKKAILIANTNKNLDNYKGFSMLCWDDFCGRARILASKLAAQRRLTLACLLCAFVGAIEQNLMHLPHLAQLEELRSMESAEFTRALSYVTNWHQDRT